MEMIRRTIRETQHSAVETKFRNKMTDAYVNSTAVFQIKCRVRQTQKGQ